MTRGASICSWCASALLAVAMRSTPRSSRSARQSDARPAPTTSESAESQALLAHLAAHAETAQRGVDEVRKALLAHLRGSSVITPARTEW